MARSRPIFLGKLARRAPLMRIVERRSAPLARRIDDLIERLEAGGDVWGVCMAELRYLKMSYETSTRRGYLSEYRKAVRRKFGAKHAALRFLKLSASDESDVEIGDARRILEQHHNLVEIDAEALIGAAVQLIRGADYAIAAGLLLLTGRRSVEILSKGNFEMSTKRQMLIFSGQAKTRGAKTARTEAYDIPVLARPALIMEAFRKLRGSLGDVEPRRRRGDVYLGYHVARYFRDKTGEAARPKDLRAMYAAICYAKFCPKTISLNAYYSKILGHSELDFGTGLSYLKYYVAGKHREARAAEMRAFLGYREGLKLKSCYRATEE